MFTLSIKQTSVWSFVHLSLKVLFLGFVFSSSAVHAQLVNTPINPEKVEIIRDQWGVPHIHGATDAEAAYGLAWANAEDDFENMQANVLATRGRLSEAIGKKGALLDVVSYMVDIPGVVEQEYETGLSDEYKKVLAGFVQGVNDYAASHPKEILLKNVFPISEKDVVAGYVLGMVGMTNIDIELVKIFKRTITKYESQLKESPFAKGSNGMAMRGHVMDDDLTTLIVNSHQPVEGQNAWYEAHVVSDEGWNFLGATFPGGITPFLGTNEHLGWTHTLNYPDFTDVYKLVMHPDEKLKYHFDGEWYDLEERKFKFKVKVAGIKLPISRTFYWSKYGATLKTKDGFYSIRFPANMGIGSGEQWYRMNKAQNFNEFEEALRLQGICGINVVYADDKDNIYYLANGHFPKRASGYNWKEVLPGDTSRTLWKPNWKPIDSLPQYLNPECGWLFNTNNSPFLATCEENNLNPADFDSRNGHLLWHNNRSLRYSGLVKDALSNTGKMSYEKLKEIKYDTKWGDPAYSFLVTNLDTLFHMDPATHPKIADALKVLSEWDRNSNPENTGAGLFSLVVVYALDYLVEEGRILFPNELNGEEFEDIISDAQKHMKKSFGDLNTPLGEIQRLVRGKQDWAIGGNVDVLAALNTKEWKGGKRRAAVADCYIQFVRYTPEGVRLETVNTFGASNREDSPHYADQVELYLNHQLKPMTLDWDAVKKAAKLTYYPGQIDYNESH